MEQMVEKMDRSNPKAIWSFWSRKLGWGTRSCWGPAAISKNQKLLADVQESSRAENQKLFEAARVENRKLRSATLSKIEKDPSNIKEAAGNTQIGQQENHWPRRKDITFRKDR